MISESDLRKYKSRDKILVSCDHCDIEFSRSVKRLRGKIPDTKKRPIRIFCSSLCWDAFRIAQPKDPIPQSQCFYCKNVYTPKYSKQRYCSKACTSRSTKKQRSEKIKKIARIKTPLCARIKDFIGKVLYSKTVYFRECQNCKKSWLATSTTSKYCSRSCANANRKFHNRSRAEMLLEEKLKEHFPTLTIKGDDTDSFPSWQLDISIPELQMAIEWDGVFHYKVVGKWTKKKQNHLEQRRLRDAHKDEMLARAGWAILRIKDPYSGEYYKKAVTEKLPEAIEYIQAVMRYYKKPDEGK